MTLVSVLTPAGSGAIATVELSGPDSWRIARELFRPARGVLPDSPALHRFWFGRFGDPPGDEVVLAVVDDEVIEVHCHGGRQVVRWLVEQCERVSLASGSGDGANTKSPATERPEANPDSITRPRPPQADRPRSGRGLWSLLERAPTLRIANILLDQCHGAFDHAISDLANIPALVAFADVGRHLLDPWRVVVAGPPNVGKSSLVNALAGYQRAVVSPVAGTTRDVTTTAVAFDGWPVELTDTAGLRSTDDELEAAGVGRARNALVDADLVIWVLDATDPHPTPPTGIPADKLLVIVNKADSTPAWDVSPYPVRVSATTGDGIPALTTVIAGRLVPSTPPPGAAIPFSPALADAVVAAATAVATGNLPAARHILTTCLVQPLSDVLCSDRLSPNHADRAGCR